MLIVRSWYILRKRIKKKENNKLYIFPLPLTPKRINFGKRDSHAKNICRISKLVKYSTCITSSVSNSVFPPATKLLICMCIWEGLPAALARRKPKVWRECWAWLLIILFFLMISVDQLDLLLIFSAVGKFMLCYCSRSWYLFILHIGFYRFSSFFIVTFLAFFLVLAGPSPSLLPLYSSPSFISLFRILFSPSVFTSPFITPETIRAAIDSRQTDR